MKCHIPHYNPHKSQEVCYTGTVDVIIAQQTNGMGSASYSATIQQKKSVKGFVNIIFNIHRHLFHIYLFLNIIFNIHRHSFHIYEYLLNSSN